MPYNQAFIDFSSSTSVVLNKSYFTTDHFKWDSIKKFLYLAYTFSSSSSNFDIFSKVYGNVRLIDFLICEVTIGMTYMCMDFFIKQYTRKIDFNNSLNPLLKGITYGILLQSALWTLLHASDVADSTRFLAASLRSVPTWSKCHKIDFNINCVSTRDIIIRCRDNNITSLNNTSAHINYLKSFTHPDKNVLTTRFFALALVWILNFFCTTVHDETLIKIFKLAFIWRFSSTILVIILIGFSCKQNIFIAIKNMLDISSPTSYSASMDHVAYAYGIGFLGVYDFGTMSPYTMIDNAVVIFTVVFTAFAIARSFIVKILYMVLTTCVKVEISVTPHYLLFAILPLSAEFLYAHKLYIIYIYMNVAVATVAYLAMMTLSMSKLLHSEFRSVKNVYIVGILCFMGFSFSVPFTVSQLSSHKLQGLVYGLKVIVLYLGGFKVAVVMWIYGVQRFSTDIQFWLGFKPTKFWTICWSFMPIVLFSFLVSRVYLLTQMKDYAMTITAVVWIGLSLLLIIVIHARTVSRYLIHSNLANILSSSLKYGPPDPEDRKRRRKYNETFRLRRCIHNCNVVDDTFDCNHLPLTFKSKTRLLSSSSESSIKDIYQAGPSKTPASLEQHLHIM